MRVILEMSGKLTTSNKGVSDESQSENSKPDQVHETGQSQVGK